MSDIYHNYVYELWTNIPLHAPTPKKDQVILPKMIQDISSNSAKLVLTDVGNRYPATIRK